MAALNGIGLLFSKLLLFLAGVIFELIDSAYQLFYGLATTRLFTNDTVQTVSNNLYILVSVVILFAFAVKLIAAIVNPDLLTDAKKGVTGVLKRTIIGLILIVAIPNIFNFLYYLQAEIITTSLVEKLVLGTTNLDSDGGLGSASSTLTNTVITGLVYPIDPNGLPITEESLCEGKENCNFADELVSLNPKYERYVSFLGGSPKYDQLDDLQIDSIWVIGNEELADEMAQSIYSVNAPLLLAASIFILYQIITLCMDAALRLVNLGILEILAPLIILSYIAGGADYLTKWAKMCAEKFLSVFIRIAALAFMILGITIMNRQDSIFNNHSATFLFKLFVIIGLLRLVKQIPDIISKIFGVSVKDGGGIKGRLGEMAGIGKMAQDAWSGMGGLAKVGAGAAVAGISRLDKDASRAIANSKFAQSRVGKALGITDKTIAERFANTGLGRGLQVAGAAYKGGSKGGVKAAKDKAKELFKDEETTRAEKIKKQNAVGQNRKIEELSKDKNGNARLKFKGDMSKVDYRATAENIRTTGSMKLTFDDIIKGYGVKHANDLKDHNEKMRDARNAQIAYDSKQGIIDAISSMRSAGNNLQKSALDNVINDIRSGKIKSRSDLQQRLVDVEGLAGTNGMSGDDYKAVANQILNRADLAERIGSMSKDLTVLENAKKEANEKLEKSTSDMNKIIDTNLSGTNNAEAQAKFKKVLDDMTKSYAELDNFQRETMSAYYADGNSAFIAGDTVKTATPIMGPPRRGDQHGSEEGFYRNTNQQEEQTQTPPPEPERIVQVAEMENPTRPGAVSASDAPVGTAETSVVQSEPTPTPQVQESTPTDQPTQEVQQNIVNNVNVDTSGIENAIKEGVSDINSHTSKEASSTREEVRNYGNGLDRKLDEVNSELGKVKENQFEADKKQDKTNNKIDDINDNLNSDKE